ncbi:MAG: XRE family transcriptional regulator [Oligoflexales bacterium]|nr:XRE family transcriptional regulator [Oligoflexales bacterium]
MENSATTDVWKFLGIDAKKSSEYRLRIMVFEKLKESIDSQNISARQLEKILDERQHRVSDLLNGKLEKFSSDKLYSYLTTLNPNQEYKLVVA